MNMSHLAHKKPEKW